MSRRGVLFAAAGAVSLLGCVFPCLVFIVGEPARPHLDDEWAAWQATVPWLLAAMAISTVTVWVLLALAFTRRRFKPSQRSSSNLDG